MGKKVSKENMNQKAQHQMWVANESPELTYDLSDCQLTDIPEGVFSSCKVLQKEALILNNNKILSWTGNGNRMESLSGILVVDFHNNKLSAIPGEIRHLRNLQVLNLSHNALTSLPPEIKELKKLQTLNISGNKLSKLPNEIGGLSSLRSLNISSNKIHKLPVTLCRVATLESLTLDADKMQYPDKTICDQGIEAIMKKICADGGVEYVPPSKAVLPLLRGEASNSSSVHPALAHLHPDNVQPALTSYEEMKRKKQQQNLLIEQENLEDSEHLTSLLKTQGVKKAHHIASLAKDNQDCEDNITQLQMKQEADRQRLYNLILEEDAHATALIDEIIKRNAESKDKEDLLQALEDERERELAQISIKNEEIAMLRKEEMLKRMREALEEIQGFNQQVAKYLQGKDQTRRDTQQQFLEEDEQLASKLTMKGTHKQEVVESMMLEDDWQRAAMESLMRKKDEKHSQLSHDISSLEKQLARLSIVEMSNKMENNKAKQEMLREQREHLSNLLIQLMDQRDLRAKEIAKRMIEMEAAREADLADFWLAQMQRLLDKKPQSLIDRESQLEYSVIDILKMSGADDYISRFAQHKVSIETMKTLDEDDLRRIGVHEVGLRKAILKNTSIYLEKIGELPDDATVAKKSAEAAHVFPTAPSSSNLDSKAKLGESPSEVLTHVTTECVICLDKQTSIVFLPCGHVCTCLECSQPLFHCPMCRGVISQKIILES